MQLMFQTQKANDGLEYINPLPRGHWLYDLRDAVIQFGRFLDRTIFRA